MACGKSSCIIRAILLQQEKRGHDELKARYQHLSLRAKLAAISKETDYE